VLPCLLFTSNWQRETRKIVVKPFNYYKIYNSVHYAYCELFIRVFVNTIILLKKRFNIPIDKKNGLLADSRLLTSKLISWCLCTTIKGSIGQQCNKKVNVKFCYAFRISVTYLRSKRMFWLLRGKIFFIYTNCQSFWSWDACWWDATSLKKVTLN
jgi:hypothetical protein